MKTEMISVRIPTSLMGELKEVARQKHFLDVSEMARSVIRNEWKKNRGGSQ